MAVDGKDTEVVTKFVFFGALITEDGLCEKEVRRRIAMGKAAMGGLTSIWKDRGVTLETKVKLVKVWCFRLYCTERRLGQGENMREGRSMLSSCCVGEEY